MRKERMTVRIADIELNEGQLPWLPRNPRQWGKDDVRRTAQSIAEDPDFLEDRPLLLVPMDGGKYVDFAGNLRLEGCRKNKRKDAPCVVYWPETDEDRATIRRRAMKDNGSFGQWDYDALANDWDDLPLTEWGIPAWDTEKKETKEKPDLSDKIDFQFKLEIDCANEQEQEQMYNELTGRGYPCRILTL